MSIFYFKECFECNSLVHFQAFMMRKQYTSKLMFFVKFNLMIKNKVNWTVLLQNNHFLKELCDTFLWVLFNRLKARATSRIQFTFYH